MFAINTTRDTYFQVPQYFANRDTMTGKRDQKLLEDKIYNELLRGAVKLYKHENDNGVMYVPSVQHAQFDPSMYTLANMTVHQRDMPANNLWDWIIDMNDLIYRVQERIHFSVKMSTNGVLVPQQIAADDQLLRMKIKNCTPLHNATMWSDNKEIERRVCQLTRRLLDHAEEWFEFDSVIDFQPTRSKIEKAFNEAKSQLNVFSSVDQYYEPAYLEAFDGFIMEGKTDAISKTCSFDSEMDIFYRAKLRQLYPGSPTRLPQYLYCYFAAYGYLVTAVTTGSSFIRFNRSFISHEAFNVHDVKFFDMSYFFLALCSRLSYDTTVEITLMNHKTNDLTTFAHLPWPFKDYRAMEKEMYASQHDLNTVAFEFYYACIIEVIKFYTKIRIGDYHLQAHNHLLLVSEDEDVCPPTFSKEWWAAEEPNVDWTQHPAIAKQLAQGKVYAKKTATKKLSNNHRYNLRSTKKRL